MYTKEAQDSYVDAALISVMQIHTKEAAGDILAFLTGQDEIDDACGLVKSRQVDLQKSYQPGPCTNFLHPLHCKAAPHASQREEDEDNPQLPMPIALI